MLDNLPFCWTLDVCVLCGGQGVLFELIFHYEAGRSTSGG